jgi:hypothetical protein
MRRSYSDRMKTYREWQGHLEDHRKLDVLCGRSPEIIDCICDQQMGRFRKVRAFSSRGLGYDSPKHEGIKHARQKRSDVDFREQVAEYLSNSVDDGKI